MLSYLCAGENGSVHCSALLPFALDGEGLKLEPMSAQEPAEIKVERFRMQQRSCYRNKAEQTNTQSSLLSPSTYFILTIGNERLFQQCDSRQGALLKPCLSVSSASRTCLIIFA